MILPRAFLVLGLSFAAAVASPTRAGADGEAARPTSFGEARRSEPARPDDAAAAPAGAAASPARHVRARTGADKTQDRQPATTNASPDRASSLAPERLRRGPSMYETGRVGKMSVSGTQAKIRQNSGRNSPRELRPPSPTNPSLTDTVTTTYPGRLDAAVLERQIRPKFSLLKNCRVEVARQKRTRPGMVTASRLTLRWTILPDGRVADTVVLATARVDGKVMDCVKRQMSQWSYRPPQGGQARVERAFRF